MGLSTFTANDVSISKPDRPLYVAFAAFSAIR